MALVKSVKHCMEVCIQQFYVLSRSIMHRCSVPISSAGECEISVKLLVASVSFPSKL